MSKECINVGNGVENDVIIDEQKFSTIRKHKTYYKQAFCKKWLKDPLLNNWIQCDPSDRFIVRCKICNCSLKNVNKKGLLFHGRSKKHLKHAESNGISLSDNSNSSRLKRRSDAESVHSFDVCSDEQIQAPPSPIIQVVDHRADGHIGTSKMNMLIEKAFDARKNAYCPYSKIKSGAAILTSDGSVFTGSTVENVNFGLTVCAERVAIMNAVSNGHTSFKCLVVSYYMNCVKYPCGSCLQVLSEFEKDCNVICVKPDKTYSKKHLLDLLPYSFCAADLMLKQRK